MRISVEGAAVGAVVAAVGRALVVLYWLGPGVGAFVALPSAGIGLLVGTIAAAPGKPWTGAAVGFVLSALVFELFLWSCASGVNMLGSLVGEERAGQDLLISVIPYMLLMGVAGAIAGGAGGAVGQARLRHKERELEHSGSAEKELPGS